VQRFVAELSQQTGMLLKHKPAEPTNPTLLIHADHDREPVQKLREDESYELAITDSGAKLTAPTPLGILHGLQTFLQLVETTPAGFAAPAVTIKTSPAFPGADCSSMSAATSFRSRCSSATWTEWLR